VSGLGTMRAALVLPLMQEAQERGVGRQAMLDTLGLEAGQLEDDVTRIPVRRVFAAWTIAMRACRDESLPIAVGKHITIRRLGVLGYALYTGPDARVSLEALSRYHDVINDSGRWRLTVTPRRCVIAWERDGERTLGMRVANEQVLASFIALADAMTQKPVTVRQVCFRHPRPRHTGAHDHHFRAPIQWGASHDALVLDPGFLPTVPRGFDPVTSDYFEERLRREADKAGPHGSWRRRVASAVAALLSFGLPTLDRIAAELRTSSRTLRRRLKEEGTSYDEILRELQLARAEELLAEGTSLRDVAFAVGYADLSAFSRAYKRWTGGRPSGRRTGRH